MKYQNPVGSIVVKGSFATILSMAILSSGSLATAKPLPLSQPSKAAPRLYDFKGVSLEISLDEFRNLPHPDGEVARVVCTGDSVTEDGKPALLSELFVKAEDASLGIKKCVWWGKRYKSLPEQPISLNLPIDGYVIGEYSFDFMPDPKDGKMRFFRFFGTSNTNANGAVVSALTTKFGPPKLQVEMVQNGFGAKFPSSTNIWANTLSILTVKEKWLEINKMAIMLTDNRLLQIVSDADAARKAKIKNPI